MAKEPVQNVTAEAQSSLPAKLDMQNLSKEQVPEVLALIQKKINTIKGNLREEPLSIKVNIPGYGDVEKLADVEALIKLLAGIREKARLYNIILEEKGVSKTKHAFKEHGYSLGKWEDFLSFRINETVHRIELDKLNNVKGILETTLSEEDKFRLTMAKALSGLLDDE